MVFIANCKIQRFIVQQRANAHASHKMLSRPTGGESCLLLDIITYFFP